MTTPIGRNKGDRIEWTLEEKNLLYYVCKSPELKDERWTKKWAIFDMVRRFTNGPQRAQRSHDALTSAWKRYQRDCNNGGALLDPWWEDEDWLRGMTELVEKAKAHFNKMTEAHFNEMTEAHFNEMTEAHFNEMTEAQATEAYFNLF